MPTESGKPLIVISYAHADEPEKPAEGEVKWLSFVTGYLRPAIKHGAVDLWLDRLMPGGADWQREIEQKLRACDIFILLVSRHSLSSDYVIDKEIDLIRERQAEGEPVHFYPLVLTPTPKTGLQLVNDKNMRPRDGKPLSDYSLHERYRHMNEAANEIANIAMKVETRRKPEPPVSPPENLAAGYDQQGRSPNLPRSTPSPQPAARDAVGKITDRISLEEWLWKQRWETAVMIAARSALRVMPLVAKASPHIGELMGAVFRASAMAWSVGKYPARAKELRAATSAAGHAAHDHNDYAAAAAAEAAAAQATEAAAAATATRPATPTTPFGPRFVLTRTRCPAVATRAGGCAAMGEGDPQMGQRRLDKHSLPLTRRRGLGRLDRMVRRTRGRRLARRGLRTRFRYRSVGTRAKERRTPGSRPICRERLRPSDQSHSPHRCQALTRPSPIIGQRRAVSPSSPALKICPIISTLRAKKTTDALLKLVELAPSGC